MAESEGGDLKSLYPLRQKPPSPRYTGVHSVQGASNAQEGQRREEVLAEVVTLHDATLNDLPAQLRNLADRIEAGVVEADSAICILPQEGDWPSIYGWGPQLNDYGNIGLLELAKAWFVNSSTGR